MFFERNAARVVLVADGRVLLQQGFDPGRPEAGTWWITPGGGVNNGESVEDAAVREVLEETGLHLSPAQLGPVIATRVAHFEFEGRRFRQRESFFAVNVEAFTPQHHGWDEVEKRALLDHRWWSVEELRATDERVYPSELADVVQAVVDGSLRGPIRLDTARQTCVPRPGAHSHARRFSQMIEVRALTKHYGTTVAVDGLSFQVPAGRVTGFLGPNGAGKTTTMRVILGLDAPTSGSVTVNGERYRRQRFPIHEVGALLDAQALHPGRSAASHLWSLAQSNRIGRHRVDEVLGMVGLSDVATRRAGPFSLGMKQRLGIAGALLGDPQILLFDEPVSGLDPEGIVWIRDLFHRLAAEGRTVFVSSHVMSEMALTAQHLIVIGRGKLIADDSIEHITAGAGSSVRVRSPRQDDLMGLLTSDGATVRSDGGALTVTGVDAAYIGDLAARHGIALHELSPQRASLEEAFFELTDESVEYHGADLTHAGATAATSR